MSCKIETSDNCKKEIKMLSKKYTLNNIDLIKFGEIVREQSFSGYPHGTN